VTFLYFMTTLYVKNTFMYIYICICQICVDVCVCVCVCVCVFTGRTNSEESTVNVPHS